jgi:choice-of-anchor B domain-containing protein
MFKSLFIVLLISPVLSIAQTPCVGGMADGYPCNGYDLQSHLPLSTFNTSGANDSWGWTDPLDGKEYVLMGLEDGTAFIDIDDPVNPIYLGKLPTHTGSTVWRDIKVYNNYAFVVSEANGHGMQVFDLTRLRNVANPPVTFDEDAHYNGFGSAHNVVINEETGYAYAVGTNSFGGGAHFVNIQNPMNPVAAGGYGTDGYIHDAQIVIYNGPDPDYAGREIMISSNGSEQVVAIVDVTDKNNPQGISTIGYPNAGYTHQGWFTEDQTYALIGDEFDESDWGFNTRTVVFDVSDLDNPVEHSEFFGTTPAIDHNGYVVGSKYYLANYSAGFREIDLSDIANGNMSEVAYFDTFPDNNNANYSGVWNVYPFFGSGNIMINDRSGGFFLVKSSAIDTEDPVAVCQNFTASLDETGQIIISGEDVDGGSTDNSGFLSFSVSPNTFDCSDIGNVITVTLTATDPSGNTDSCTAEVTVVDNSGPIFDCYTDETMEYDAGQSYYTLPDYVLNGDVTAMDNCTSPLAISQDPAPGTQLTLGTYTITFESTDDEGNPGSCSFELTVIEELGIADFLAQGLSIFPNPASTSLTIHSKNVSINTIQILDISGKQLLEMNVNDQNEVNLNVSNMAQGIYFMRLNNQITKKIIIN